MAVIKTQRVRKVKKGDTILLIAAEMYGDPRLWRKIADANGIKDPLQFPLPDDVGAILQISV
jgi:nucleoid-associated protein YgaU